MAKLKLLLLSFLFYTIFPCFFHCTLSLINPQDMESEDINMVQTQRDSSKKCDFSEGKWVFDQSYPLYDSNCPYLTTAVTCQKNGRPDSDYEKWKWKPNGCYIPRCFYIIYTQCQHVITIILYACMTDRSFLSLLWYLLMLKIQLGKVVYKFFFLMTPAGLMHWVFWVKWEERE